MSESAGDPGRQESFDAAFAHAGTLFSLFVADVLVGDLRPFELRIVDLLPSALLEEGLPTDALGHDPSDV